MRFFGRKRAAERPPPAEVYADLRQQVLGLTPDELGNAALADAPLPTEGLTQFVAVTPEGIRGVVAPEGELGEGRHDLSPLFYAGQDVITQIRLTQGGLGAAPLAN
jgi:hypothetical protein